MTINIVDNKHREKSYLTMQSEMDIPMVVALNMMDEVLGNQGSIDVNMMEALLEFRNLYSRRQRMAALKNPKPRIAIAKYQEHPLRQDFLLR